MSRGYSGGFAPYVSKAQKLRRSEKACAALAKKGVKLEPVRILGSTIAKTCGAKPGRKIWNDTPTTATAFRGDARMCVAVPCLI